MRIGRARGIAMVLVTLALIACSGGEGSNEGQRITTDLGLSLNVGEQWEIETSGTEVRIATSSDDLEILDPSGSQIVISRNPTADDETFEATAEDDVVAATGLSTQPTTLQIGGVEAVTIALAGETTNRQWYFVNLGPGRFYLIEAAAPAADWETSSLEMQAILDSLEFDT